MNTSHNYKINPTTPETVLNTLHATTHFILTSLLLEMSNPELSLPSKSLQS